MDRLYKLSFFLPRGLLLSVHPGRYHPCLAGCVVRTDAVGWTTIEGPSREIVFAQWRRWLRDVCRGHGPQDITAVLRSPRQGDRERWTGRHGAADSWTAIVGADVAIVPGARVGVDLGQFSPA